MANSNISRDAKIELVRSIRQTHEANTQTINKREAILYGKPLSSFTNSSDNYKDINPDQIPGENAFKPILTFKIRAILATILFMCFLFLESAPNISFAPIKLQVKTYINKDFTNNLVAYLEDLTYTLDYEKISIK